MKPSFDETELLVIKSLGKHFSACYRRGEDPPDAYLQMPDGNEIAVEITMLTQHVSDGRGNLKPRLSEDSTAIRLANDLNDELQDFIPEGFVVILTLASPISQARKTKAQLKKLLSHISTSHGTEVSENILGNNIDILVSADDRPSGKKVVGIITNQKSSPDILQNAMTILQERIADKAKKCRSLAFNGPKWLALFNDYWLSDKDTYQQALGSFSLNHPFEKILLVSGNGSVNMLYEEGGQ